MTITITDPALLAQFTRSEGPIQVRDPSGRLIGTFTAELFGKPPPGYFPPISEEEAGRRQQLHPDGKPLSEILARLQSKTQT